MKKEEIKKKIETIISCYRYDNDEKLKISLFGGYLIGNILLLSEYRDTFKTTDYDIVLEKKIELLVSLNLENEGITFCNGLSGFAWFLNFLVKDKIVDIDIELFLSQVDPIIFKKSLEFIRSGNDDFLHGAVGNMVYLLDRIEVEKSRKYLEQLIYELEATSIKHEDGIAWISLFDETESFNIGLSHGLASKVVLFSKLLEKGVLPEIVKPMLKGMVNFTLKNKNKDQTYSVFPNSISKNNKVDGGNSALRWCYGDLGISIALWQAGEALEDKGLKQEAINVCLHSTKRKTVKETGIVDAGICHGTAGNAHVYNRMYRYTQRVEFKEAADFWIQKTLEMSTFKDGLAGYKRYNANNYDNSYGLLEGVAGIGLTLLSHINDDEAKWDRCFLLS